jgi:tol-pal system protein YbgF
VRAWTSIAVLAALPLLAGCVSTSEFRKLENRVHELSGGEVGAQTRAQLADVTARMDRLAREVDELRGALEVANHNAAQALDEARQAREDAGQQGASLPPVVPTEPAAAPAPAPAPGAGGPIVESSPGASSSSAEEVQSYRTAYGSWRRGEVQACIEGFREFLQTYPSSPYADDALYWMADCYTRQGDHEKAILRFAKIVEMYPTGNKAPDALFRQGEVLLKLGPGYNSAARDVFQRVVKEYPDSPRASEARRELDRLGAG